MSSNPVRRERIARLERPLLVTGLALVTAHLLDLVLSGPATTVLGVLVLVLVIVVVPLAQPHLTCQTRLALGAVVGLLTLGLGAVSHGLHAVNFGPDWRDVTGVGSILGGLLLVVAGLSAVAAPQRAPRPVLLIAAGGLPEEIPASRRYRDAGGRSVKLWGLPDAAHTGGLRKHRAEYERQAIRFLDAALGTKPS